jgi:Mother cell inhibitor of FtsZ
MGGIDMKIFVHDHGVIISGKAWEIREKLKEYGKHYQFLSDWVENNSQNPIAQSANRSVLHFDRK